MTVVAGKLTVPEVLADFSAYYAKHPAWGVLHVVLDDGNWTDGFVDGCISYAVERGDAEGERLARLLRQLTVSQRMKIARLA